MKQNSYNDKIFLDVTMDMVKIVLTFMYLYINGHIGHKSLNFDV